MVDTELTQKSPQNDRMLEAGLLYQWSVCRLMPGSGSEHVVSVSSLGLRLSRDGSLVSVVTLMITLFLSLCVSGI